MATTTPTIRPATAADAAAVAAIYNQAVLTSTATFDLEPETVAARAAWLAAPGTRLCLVGEVAGRVAGWSSLVRWSARAGYDQTAEASIYVAPDAQRSGLGVALAGAAVAAAPALGLHVVIAQICADNAGGWRWPQAWASPASARCTKWATSSGACSTSRSASAWSSPSRAPLPPARSSPPPARSLPPRWPPGPRRAPLCRAAPCA